MKSTVLFLFHFFFLYTLLFSSEVPALDIKDRFSCADNLDQAIQLSQNKDRKILVYCVSRRDQPLLMDYEILLFNNRDIVNLLSKVIFLRESVNQPKSEMLKTIKAVTPAFTPGFMVIDPKRIENISGIAVYQAETSRFMRVTDVAIELYTQIEGKKPALNNMTDASSDQTEAFNRFSSTYEDVYKQFDTLPDKQAQDAVKRLGQLFSGTIAVQILENRLKEKQTEEKRIQACGLNQQVVDLLVVCFDVPSYFREIGRWDENTFWPVLLYDPLLVKNFIKAFKPKSIRIAKPLNMPVTRALLYETVIAAQSAALVDHLPDATSSDLKTFYLTTGHIPKGAVLMHENAPETAGGVALAAARRQWPVMYTYGDPEKNVAVQEAETIRKAVFRLLNTSGYDMASWGDIDFLTIASSLPFGYLYPASAHGGPYALDDAIARKDNELRCAYVGRLMYGAANSVYQAMCALFLTPGNGLFWSSYNTDIPYRYYWPGEKCMSVSQTVITASDATLDAWNLMMAGGNPFPLIFINSAGGPVTWSTSKGQGWSRHIPFSVPTAVHMVHSHSLATPFDIRSIGPRWIQGGAFIYFGSYDEPSLDAFVMPEYICDQLEKGISFGEAFRWHNGSFRWRPWKLAYVGDPMYTNSKPSVERISANFSPDTMTPVEAVRYFSQLINKTENKKYGHLSMYRHACGFLEGKDAFAASTEENSFKDLTDKERNMLFKTLMTQFLFESTDASLDLFSKFSAWPDKTDQFNLWMYNRFFVRLKQEMVHNHAVTLDTVCRSLSSVNEKKLIRRTAGFLLMAAHDKGLQERYQLSSDELMARIDELIQNPILKQTIQTRQWKRKQAN